MLAASLRSLAQSLPALLAATGSLATILDHKLRTPTCPGGAAFPKAVKGLPEQAPGSNHEEEKDGNNST